MPRRHSRSSSCSSNLDTGDDPKNDIPHDPPASWRTLPHKAQLVALALCRFSEPLTQTSLLSYLYYLLASFPTPDGTPPSAATISRQAGMLQSSFAFAQCLTGFMWGRLSDRIGRKPVILLGLFGTTVSVLGFAFAESFHEALAWRVLGGALNGNVGVLRTVVSETVREKKHQARAFLVMPMCFNIGIVLGPAIGGLLADPAGRWRGGGEAASGPARGVDWPEWVLRWPYALPNVVSAGFLMGSWLVGLFLLQETLESKRGNPDIGDRILRSIRRRFRRKQHRPRSHPSSSSSSSSSDTEADGGGEPASEHTPLLLPAPTPSPAPRPPPPFLSIFTPNIILTLICFTLIPLHNATWMQLYSIFLSAPAAPASAALTGGLGLAPKSVGSALSLLGGLGIVMQLAIYPPVQLKMGLLKSYRWSCGLFPIAYLATPMLVFLLDATGADGKGFAVWAGIAAVLAVQVTGRTFAFPASIALLTNAVEVEGVLGTVHGVGSSLMAFARTVGPLVGAWGLAKGMDGAGVEWVFWALATVALVGWMVSWRLKEGRGLGIKGTL